MVIALLDLDDLTVDTILAELKRFLRVPGLLSGAADPVLRPIVEAIIEGLGFLDLLRSFEPVDAQFGYEGIAGGLANRYGDVFEILEEKGEVRGGLPNTFIPTYSALALDHPPDTDLTNLSQINTPFSEIIYQSRDRPHNASETDVVCRELRRMAGVPYITGVEPSVRVAGEGDFTLTVRGGNFTSRTTVSWEGEQRPTIFVSSGVVTARISIFDIAEPTTEPLFAEVIRPKIVSVNDFDSEGAILADDFYADLANCTIGVLVQGRPIVIEPLLPSAKDRISAVYVGEWNTGCIPTDPRVSISGNRVTVTAGNPVEFCTFAFTPFALPVTFGPLAAGEYELVFLDQRGGSTTELGQRTFLVTRARPSISLLRLANVIAGAPGFTLVVEGADFASGVSTVYWNGVEQPTTFVDSGELQARISAAEIVVAGNAAITVRSGSDGPVSEPATLTIAEAPPSITSISPDSAVEGSGTLLLSIEGMNFAPGAAVLWTGAEGITDALSTRFVSSTSLEATAPATLLATPGSYPLAVSSGGLISAGEFFVVESAAGSGLPVIAATVNGASFLGGASRGAITTIFGENLGTGIAEAQALPLPTTLEGVRVLVAGRPAALFYVSPGQINFQVPFETPLGDSLSVQVIRDGLTGPESSMVVMDYALGIFQYPREPGVLDAVITHADDSLVTPDNPARPSEVIIVYATGVGLLDNAPPTGAAAPFEPLATAQVLPQVILAGSSAGAFGRALFAGLAPGFVGLIQMNIELPASRPPDADLKLGVRFREEDSYLLVPLPVAME